MKRYAVLLLCALLVAANAPLFAKVFYRLEGFVHAVEDGNILHTVDGRVFSLEGNASELKKLDGKLVLIEGFARQADDLQMLKVKKVQIAPAKADQVVLPEYHIRQKGATLASEVESQLVVDNVRTGFKLNESRDITEYYWNRMQIDSRLLDQVYFIKKPFAPEWLAAHSCLLFTFKPGGLTDQKGRSSSGLLLSVEAHQKKGQNYSLKDGFFNKFGMIWLLITWEDYSAEACDAMSRGAGKMFLYPVLLDQAKKRKLLHETVRQATVNRSGEFYHTIRNNCTNALVILFNRVMDKKVKLWSIPSMIYNYKATMPIWVPDYLRKKGILGPSLPEINKTNYFVDIDQIAKQAKPVAR